MFLVFPTNIKRSSCRGNNVHLGLKAPERKPEAASAISNALLSPRSWIDWQGRVGRPPRSLHCVSYQRQPSSIKLSGKNVNTNQQPRPLFALESITDQQGFNIYQ